MKIEKYTGCLISVFAFPHKDEVEVLKHGIVSKLEVPVLDIAKLIFIPGSILVSGNSQAYKMALQVLTPFMNISGKYFKPTQEKLFELSEQATVVKTMKFGNIPSSEVEQLTFSGEIEDAFNHGSLPLKEAEIKHFNGVFYTPYGVKTVKFSSGGKVTIAKSKKSPIKLDFLGWVIDTLIN